MGTGLPTISTDRPSRRFRANGWTAVLLLLAGLAILAAGLVDPAWARRSGGYSRPSGGGATSFFAPSRRPPISASGGHPPGPAAPGFPGKPGRGPAASGRPAARALR